MGFQLALNRRYVLDGLADGWNDEHHLTFRVMSSDEIRKIQADGVDKLEGEAAFDALVKTLAPRVVSGLVVNTKDDGTTENLSVDSKNAAAVLTAFPVSSLRDFFEHCLGFTAKSTSTL